MATERTEKFWTVEEYLAYEQETGIKHEYIDGEIFAMSGGTDNHSEIAVNCTIELSVPLRGRAGCRRFNSDMKVKISERKYVYPDFSIVCGKAEFSDDAHAMLTNPTLVAEVTSDSSKSYDKIKKAEFYRSLTSLQIYLIIDQDRPHAELYVRQEKVWIFQEFNSLEDVIPLDVIGCTLPMSEVYRDIELDNIEPDLD